MTKQEIRNQLTALRKSKYDSRTIRELSLPVITQLEADADFQKARCILLFHSLPDEVYTHSLIEKYCHGKTILLPSVVGDDIELHVYEGRTKTGPFNISESEGPLFTDYGQIDLAVIPGVAFDHEGNRLGRGKGYYDRFLPRLTCKTIGLCLTYQLLPHIPTEGHDRKVEKVITECRAGLEVRS